MRLAEHLTRRRFALGANNACLVGEKPDVLRPAIVGMRGPMLCLLYTSDAADE